MPSCASALSGSSPSGGKSPLCGPTWSPLSVRTTGVPATSSPEMATVRLLVDFATVLAVRPVRRSWSAVMTPSRIDRSVRRAVPTEVIVSVAYDDRLTLVADPTFTSADRAPRPPSFGGSSAPLAEVADRAGVALDAVDLCALAPGRPGSPVGSAVGRPGPGAGEDPPPWSSSSG